MPKIYKNYKELAEAFKSGELDKKHYFLMLDKSGTENTLSRHYDDSISEVENDRLMEEAGKMFPGDHEIEEIFEAAGIPCEWC